MNFDLAGQATMTPANGGTSIVFLDLQSTLNATNFATRATVSSVALTELKGTKSGNDLSFTGKGTARYSTGGGAASTRNVEVQLALASGKVSIKVLDSGNGNTPLIDASTPVFGAALKLNVN